jgi:hypothetical protein
MLPRPLDAHRLLAAVIDYFADDPSTRSIVLYMESIRDVRKFLSTARGVSRTKPVIVCAIQPTACKPALVLEHIGPSEFTLFPWRNRQAVERTVCGIRFAFVV